MRCGRGITVTGDTVVGDGGVLLLSLANPLGFFSTSRGIGAISGPPIAISTALGAEHCLWGRTSWNGAKYEREREREPLVVTKGCTYPGGKLLRFRLLAVDPINLFLEITHNNTKIAQRDRRELGRWT